MFKNFIFILTALLINTTTTIYAIEGGEFSMPKKEQLVIDEANIFSSQETEALKNKLHRFSRETSTQILIYTTPDLQGYDIADYGQQLGEKLGVGGSKFDNGIVIVFKPKTTDSPGRITLQTGYGIEALIPDATANQIIDVEMIPHFKQGDIYGGIDAAVNTCISLTKGEYTAQAYHDQHQSSGGGAGIIIFIFMITFFSMLGRSRQSRYSNMGTRSNLPLWTALFLMGNGSNRGSGFGDFSSGSGSFGGGGGFGGFGGGSFGGGGASGSW